MATTGLLLVQFTISTLISWPRPAQAFFVIFFLFPDLDYTIRQRLRCQERAVHLAQTPAVRHFRGNAPQFNSPSPPRCEAAQERVGFKKGRMPYVRRMQRARLNVFHQTDTLYPPLVLESFPSA
jgi:hypothetical protein